MRVLLVDDSAAVRSRLREMLGDAGVGIEIREAADEEEALAAASEPGPLGAIVLDLHLKAAGGLSVLEPLRERAPDALVVVLTNDAGERHRRESKTRGAHYFFDKSRDFERAVQVIVDRAARGS